MRDDWTERLSDGGTEGLRNEGTRRGAITPFPVSPRGKAKSIFESMMTCTPSPVGEGWDGVLSVIRIDVVKERYLVAKRKRGRMGEWGEREKGRKGEDFRT